MAFSEVREITEAEMDSLVDARAAGEFTSLEDLWRRAELSRPVLENLVHIGALDAIAGDRPRRELLWRAVDLASQPAAARRSGRVASRVPAPRVVTHRTLKPSPPKRTAKPKKAEPSVGQLGFQLDEPITANLPGLRPYTAYEEIQAELEVGGIDARRHVMEVYEPLLKEAGCVAAADIGKRRNNSEVWVAGVKVASQTPAIRSGQRIIFLTLDDPTGPLDVTIFERVQPWCAQTAFHSWLLLVRGTLKKRGGASFVHATDPKNVAATIIAEELFDLAALSKARRAGQSLTEAIENQRAQLRSGMTIAFTNPAGSNEGSKPSAKLWHSSGGSAG